MYESCQDAARLNTPQLHLIGRRLQPELAAVASELKARAAVYSFESTDELCAAWRIARRNSASECMRADAVVWLQGRSGEFAQGEVNAVHTLDPLAKRLVVAGCWSEGEPRSGRPLTGAMRIYWHQGSAAILSHIDNEEETPARASYWLAIHTARHADYQAIAGLCEARGQRTIWQAPHWPAISSEPALRVFDGWASWQAWREQEKAKQDGAPAILLQGFPRPADHQRARAAGIAEVLALPLQSTNLQRIIGKATAASVASLRIQHKRQIRSAA